MAAAPSRSIRGYARSVTGMTLALVVGGALWLAAGSVTVVPFLEDERRHEAIRAVWLEASRQLPDSGFPTVTAALFWLVIAALLLAGIALAVVVGRFAVDPDDAPGDVPASDSRAA